MYNFENFLLYLIFFIVKSNIIKSYYLIFFYFPNTFDVLKRRLKKEILFFGYQINLIKP